MSEIDSFHCLFSYTRKCIFQVLDTIVLFLAISAEVDHGREGEVQEMQREWGIQVNQTMIMKMIQIWCNLDSD